MKCLLDRLNNSIEIDIDFRVPESQRAKASTAKYRNPHHIVVALNVFSMLASIDLDDQSMLEGDEIRIEPQQRGLSAEVKTFWAHLPKLKPEANLLPCHRLAKRSRTFR